MSPTNSPIPPSISILGCGKLGSAVLEGLLAYCNESTEISKPLDFSTAHYTITVTARSAETRQNLSQRYIHPHRNVSLQVKEDNVLAARAANIVILGCKPIAHRSILGEEGMREALRGKVVVSIMVGVSTRQLEDAVYGAATKGDKSEDGPGEKGRCAFITAIPNTAAAVRQSVTLILDDDTNQSSTASIGTISAAAAPLPSPLAQVTSLFSHLGRVKIIAPSQLPSLPTLASLAASTAAFHAFVVEGIVKGAVAMGVDAEDALELAVGALSGAAGLLSAQSSSAETGDVDGESNDRGGLLSPKDVRRRIATPGGSTAQGLAFLEERDLTGLMAEAVKRTSVAASQLGVGLGGEKPRTRQDGS